MDASLLSQVEELQFQRNESSWIGQRAEAVELHELVFWV